MKSEFNHRYQLNNEFRVDSDASKLIFDLIIEQPKKKAFKFLCMIFNLIHLVSYYCLEFNSANDSCIIRCYLTKILDKFKIYSFFKHPAINVTDFSWANINALMKICFKIIVKKELLYKRPLKTIIYICDTHMLKNIIDETERLIKFQSDQCKNKIKKQFFVDEILTLLSKKIFKSLNFIEFNLKMSNNVSDPIFHFNDETKTQYKTSSPFTHYFEDLFSKNVEKYENDHDDCDSNIYFNNNLWLVIKNRLHLTPLWSRIIFSEFDFDFSRRSNNMIES
ncbi:hypothetical protein BpHYR1_029180 [Brachionus plicatilis]|uniref:Uncharacterized protein n=1 Tax=Brachionus plicatilis TaxID=10195 RepID=A0A3M7RLS1_BRAPC|nr:hypothetical protein BpHYR1_029180 [Brachionus plicatilis]